MKPTSKLDRAIRIQQFKDYLKWLPILALFGAIYFFLYFDKPVETKVVFGTTVSLGVQESKFDRARFWIVKLDSDSLVRVYWIGNSYFKAGQRVELKEILTENGYTKYRLIRISK